MKNKILKVMIIFTLSLLTFNFCSERDFLIDSGEEASEVDKSVLLPIEVGNVWLYNFWFYNNSRDSLLVDENRYLQINGIITIDDKSYYRADDNLSLLPFDFNSNITTIVENRIDGLYIGELLINEKTVDWKCFFKYPVEEYELYSYNDLSTEVSREIIVTYFGKEYDCILYSFEHWKVYIVPGKGFVKIEDGELIHDLMLYEFK